MLTRKLTRSIPPSEQRFANTDHPRIMEETKSLDRTNMVLGLFLDSMTINFQNQVVIDEQAEDILKGDKKTEGCCRLFATSSSRAMFVTTSETCLKPPEFKAKANQ